MQVKGIPFLVFDVGGVLEMFDPSQNREAVVWEPTLDALYAKLQSEALGFSLAIPETASKFTSRLRKAARHS